MKTAVAVLSCGLLASVLLYPTGLILSACFGYVFELFNVAGFALAVAALSLGLVVLELVCRPAMDQTRVQGVIAVIPLFSLIHAVCCVLTCPKGWTIEKEPVIVHYGKLGRPMEIYWESDDCLMVDGCEHLMEEYAN